MSIQPAGPDRGQRGRARPGLLPGTAAVLPAPRSGPHPPRRPSSQALLAGSTISSPVLVVRKRNKDPPVLNSKHLLWVLYLLPLGRLEQLGHRSKRVRTGQRLHGGHRVRRDQRGFRRDLNRRRRRP